MTDLEVPGRIALISALTPTSLTRAWQTVPHPTRPLAATCSSDKTVRVYSLTSFTQVSSIQGGHTRSVRAAAWKPVTPATADESTLATGSFDRSVCMWRHEHEKLGMDFKGSSEAKADDDEEEDDEDWAYFCVLDGPDSEIKSVTWSAGGNMVAMSSRDKSVWVWEEETPEDYSLVAMLQEHSGDVKTVAWHPEEELLASGSYDDDVRLWREVADNWECIALLGAHSSTVWTVEWEGAAGTTPRAPPAGDTPMDTADAWLARRASAGPRLATCSDDRSVKIWRRHPRDRDAATAPSALSTIRTDYHREDWAVEATLPVAHDLAIYSVAWSRRSGRIASCGGDGRVVVYEERWATDAVHDEQGVVRTEWVVVAALDEAHDVFEINHVAWAPRADKGRSGAADEEVLITTGDDGVVKVWAFDL